MFGFKYGDTGCACLGEVVLAVVKKELGIGIIIAHHCAVERVRACCKSEQAKHGKARD